MQSLSLSAIRLDVALQPRAALDYGVVEEYARLYASATVMPPIVVYKDGAGVCWVADGFHRVSAAQSAGLTHIHADVRDGERQDAMWFAASVNSVHGLPRRPQDKRRAVEMALAHERSRGLSDRAIAEHCCVSHQLVGEVRSSSLVAATSQDARRKGKDGRETAPSTEKRKEAQAARREKERAAKPTPSIPALPPTRSSAHPRESADTRSAESAAARAALRAFYALTAAEQVWFREQIAEQARAA